MKEHVISYTQWCTLMVLAKFSNLIYDYRHQMKPLVIRTCIQYV